MINFCNMLLNFSDINYKIIISIHLTYQYLNFNFLSIDFKINLTLKGNKYCSCFLFLSVAYHVHGEKNQIKIAGLTTVNVDQNNL